MGCGLAVSLTWVDSYGVKLFEFIWRPFLCSTRSTDLLDEFDLVGGFLSFMAIKCLHILSLCFQMITVFVAVTETCFNVELTS